MLLSEAKRILKENGYIVTPMLNEFLGIGEKNGIDYLAQACEKGAQQGDTIRGFLCNQILDTMLSNSDSWKNVDKENKNKIRKNGIKVVFGGFSKAINKDITSSDNKEEYDGKIEMYTNSIKKTLSTLIDWKAHKLNVKCDEEMKHYNAKNEAGIEEYFPEFTIIIKSI